MTRHKCFNCGEPTETQVNRTRPPALRKFICTDTRCWRVWWAHTDKQEANRA